jgi:hypothetical protein
MENEMPWRYQPVYLDEDGDPAYTLVEVYFDEAGNFTSWAEGDAAPMGADVETLTEDLNRMLVDAICWEPVKVSDLAPGMKFTPRVSMEDRRAVADFVDANASTMKRHPKPARN